MGKQKKPFIDPANAAHFHLVHRSQRDPRAADPEAPQRVLAPLPETGNQARKSVRGTQSTRAILQEQDLDGFDEAVDDPAEAAAIREAEAFNELGLPTGYNYEQHLRPIGQAPGAHFIPAPRSVASMACSRLSQGTRATGRTSASARSRRGELVLREEVGGEAFASVDELDVGVSGMTEVDREAEAEAVEEAKEALGDDVWEALQGDWEDGDDPGMDDDFVLRLETGVIRETEMLRAPARKPKGGKTHATAAAEGEEEHEEEEEETEEGRYDDAEDDEEEEGAVAAGGAAAAAKAPQGGGERRPNPFAELFGSLDDDDEDEDEDEDEDDENDEDAGWGALATGGGGAGRLGAANAAAAARPTRLLDEQFARLMAEYDEEEIGELDEDDPTVQGAASIEAYEHARLVAEGDVGAESCVAGTV